MTCNLCRPRPTAVRRVRWLDGCRRVRSGAVLRALFCLGTALAAAEPGAPAPPWPQCAIKPAGAGGPAIVIDGRDEPPLWLALNNQFQRDELMLDEVRLAHTAGIDHLGFLVYLDWYWTPEQAARTIDRFCAANPAASFYIQVWLGPNDAWKQAHPEEMMTKADGTRTDYVSLASAPWRAEATAQLRRRLGEILAGPHASRFLGVEVQYLNTAEWFYPETNDFMDYSAANLTHWRTWLQSTYADAAALRQAWGDPAASFATAAIPTPALRTASAWGPWRDPVRHRPAIDLQRCQSELVADTVASFAAVVKDVTLRRSLVSVFYGYTMELTNNGPRALPQSGHLALRRLLECPDVDIVRAPYSYFQRALGEPGHLHSPAHSIAAHGKLALFDDDSYTHLARAPEGPIIAPGWPDRTKTLAESLSLNRRNAFNFLGCGAGISWYDLLSDARWNAPEIWQSAAQISAIATEARGRAAFAPQVAFLVDEESPHLTRPDVYPELLHGVSWCRAELDRLGAPVGYWLLSDAAALPATTRLIIVANAWHLDDAVRRNLLERIAAGAVVLWVRAPDVWGEAGADPARIATLTGMPVQARFETTTPPRILCAPTGYRIDFEQQRWEPCFVVEPRAGVEVLAHYETTNETAAAMVRSGAGWSAYTAFPRLPIQTLRLLCERAGVHLYRDTEGSTAVVGNYLIVHTAAAATHRLRWPRPCKTVQRLVPEAPAPLARNVSEWTDDLPAGTTAVYRCEAATP